ncbi:hypothetical protein D049_4841A, partial [Vibrio parahaemolyticus VPTS-2010]
MALSLIVIFFFLLIGFR